MTITIIMIIIIIIIIIVQPVITIIHTMTTISVLLLTYVIRRGESLRSIADVYFGVELNTR